MFKQEVIEDKKVQHYQLIQQFLNSLISLIGRLIRVTSAIKQKIKTIEQQENQKQIAQLT